MRIVKWAKRRWRFVADRGGVEREWSDEMRFHLEQDVAACVAAGVPPEEARRRALVAFGGVGIHIEEARDGIGFGWARDAARDARFALRLMRKDRAYALAAMAALALGIGANVTLFSLFSAVALTSMPGVHPERLVALDAVSPNARFGTFSYGDYVYLRDHTTTLASLAIQQPSHLRLTGATLGGGANDGPAEPVMGLYVGANYFDTYGVHPTVGRGLTLDDERATAGPFAALISDSFWERRFQRNPAVLGSRAVLSGTPVTIVGVTRPGFMGTRPEVPDFWITMAALGDVSRRALDRVTLCCELTGRLADGVTPQRAEAELRVLNDRAQADQPASDRRSVRVHAAKPFGNYQDAAGIIFAALQVAMALVLLIACANVAALLLGRAAAREREIAVRLAMGAARRRLVRQLVTEGVVLALVAGALSLVVTWLGLTVGARYAAAALAQQGGGSMSVTLTPSPTLLAYVALTSVVAGLLFALAPALQATRRDLADALRDGSTGAGMSRQSRLRGALIAAQVAVCLALLVDAGLLSVTSLRVLRIEPGFAHDNILSVWIIDPREVGYDSVRAAAIGRQIEDRVRQLPGVRRVSATSRVPLGGNVAWSVASAAPDPAATAARFAYEYVSEDYFATLALRMRGRGFTRAEVESRAPVVVVSDTLARTLWPGQDPIGRQLFLGSRADASRRQFGAALSGSAQVIGVVSDVRGLALTAQEPGEFYLPARTNLWSSRLLVDVGSSDSRVVRRGIALAAREVAPTVPVSMESLNDVIAADGAHVMSEVAGAVLALVGSLGLLLALVGIYGAVAYSVRQQRREIGIRMALGARSLDVIGLFVRGTARWVFVGSVIGLVLAMIGAKLVESSLYLAAAGSMLNPAIMLAIVVLVGAVALLAAFASARRASEFDPAQVLQAS